MWLVSGFTTRVTSLVQTIGAIPGAVSALVEQTAAIGQSVLDAGRETLEDIQPLRSALFDAEPIYDPALAALYDDFTQQCPMLSHFQGIAQSNLPKRAIMHVLEQILNDWTQIRVENGDEQISESAKQMVANIFNSASPLLNDFSDQAAQWFNEQLQAAAMTSTEESLLTFGFEFLNPVKNEKLYQYLRGKIETVAVFVFQECLNEGKRLQSQDETLQNLDDNALLLLGVTSIATFVGQEMLQDKLPVEILEALGEKYPQFKKIKLPEALIEPFLDALKNKGLVAGMDFVVPMTALTSQLSDINQDLINVWGEDTSKRNLFSPPASTIAKPLAGITSIATSVVRDLLTETGNDSVAYAVAEQANKFGFEIQEGQMENLLGAIANTDLPEMQSIRDGIGTYAEATVKELFVRLGKKVQEEDHEILDLMQNVVVHLGTYMAEGDPAGLEAARDPEFYHQFTLDLLKTLGLQGPDDLFFIPEPLRELVWKKLSEDVIETKLKELMEGIFNPHFIREQIVNALKDKSTASNEPTVEREERLGMITCVTEEEHKQAQQHALMTERAFSKIYENFVDQFTAKNNPIRLLLKKESVSRKVGTAMSDAMVKGLTDLCGDATGKPSLMSLLINVLNGVDFDTPNAAPKELSVEDQVKNYKAKVAARRAQYEQAKLVRKEAREAREVSRTVESDASYQTAKQKASEIKAQLKIDQHQLEGAKISLKEKQDRIRVEMQDLIQEVSKENAEAFVGNLWNSIQTAFSRRVREMCPVSVSTGVIQLFQRIGEFIFLKLLRSICANMAVHVSKQAAQKLDRYLDYHTETFEVLSYYALREIQQTYLNGPAASALRQAPARKQAVENDEAQEANQSLWDEIYGDGDFVDEEDVDALQEPIAEVQDASQAPEEETINQPQPPEEETINQPQPIRWEQALWDPERRLPVYPVNFDNIRPLPYIILP